MSRQLVSSADFAYTPRSFTNAGSYSICSSNPSGSPGWNRSESSYRGSPDHSTFSSNGDEYRMPRGYSESAAPSTHSALTSFGQAMTHQETATLPSRRMLGCEFNRWTGCQQEFQLGEVDLWIRHAEEEHLRHNYPAVSKCWYCDDFVFQQYPDAGSNFGNRMRHIADHILFGHHFEHRRPDFHFLDHVNHLGLITPQVFQEAIRETELPPMRGAHRAGWRPKKEEPPVVEVEISGKGRRRHRNQQRHL